MAKTRNRFSKQRFSVVYQYLIGIFLLLSVLTFSILTVLDVAGRPFQASKEKAEQLASQYAQLTEISQVDIYNGKETYSSVIGSNAQGQEMLVLIPENSTEIMVYQLTDGISQTEAEAVASANGATTIDRVLAGYRDGKVIWEIKSGTGYYLVDFATGEFIIKEGL